MADTLQARARTRGGHGPSVEVVLFTDPYSTWCWASEPVWLRLRESYGHQVRFRAVMGGLVEAGRDVLDPERLAWLRIHMHDVAARSGQPIDASFLDDLDGTFSTWPACIHVKAAQQQGEDMGQRFLRRLRVAVMTEARDASGPRTAEALLGDVEGLDATAWRGALADGSALQAFLDDRAECGRSEVHGFPTLLIRVSDPRHAPRVLEGHRPYAQAESALRDAAPWLRARPPRPVVDILFDLGPLTTREVQEVQGVTPREALDDLDGLAAAGTVEAVRRAGGTLWRLM